MADRLDAIAADDALLDSLAAGHAVAAPIDRNLVGLLGALRSAVATDTVDGYVVRAVDPVRTELARLRREALASLSEADLESSAVERAGRMARRVPAWLAAGGLVVGSVSGVAAAVSGDPFRPYQSVVHHVVQQIQNAAPHFGTAARNQFVLSRSSDSGLSARDSGGQQGYLEHHHRWDRDSGRASDADDRTQAVHSERRADDRSAAQHRPAAHPHGAPSPQRIAARPVPTASPVTASPTRTQPGSSPVVSSTPADTPTVATDKVADSPNSFSDTAVDAPPATHEPRTAQNPAAPTGRPTAPTPSNPSSNPTSAPTSSPTSAPTDAPTSSDEHTGRQSDPKPDESATDKAPVTGDRQQPVATDKQSDKQQSGKQQSGKQESGKQGSTSDKPSDGQDTKSSATTDAKTSTTADHRARKGSTARHSARHAARAAKHRADTSRTSKASRKTDGSSVGASVRKTVEKTTGQDSTPAVD